MPFKDCGRGALPPVAEAASAAAAAAAAEGEAGAEEWTRSEEAGLLGFSFLMRLFTADRTFRCSRNEAELGLARKLTETTTRIKTELGLACKLTETTTRIKTEFRYGPPNGLK